MIAHTMTSSLSTPGSLYSVVLKEFFFLLVFFFLIRDMTDDDKVSITEKSEMYFIISYTYTFKKVKENEVDRC